MAILVLPYALSQYVWFIIVCLPLLALLNFHGTTSTKDFFSADLKNSWDTNDNPFWMVHATDLHLSVAKPNSYENAYTRMKKALDVLKPLKVLITGDIADSSINTSKFRPYQHQRPEDWDLYKKLMDELGLNNDGKLIHLAGNHDICNVPSFNAKSHYANGILYNESTFLINKNVYNDGNKSISILTVNPYHFPAALSDYELIAYPPKELRNQLVDELAKNENDITILAAHHPALHWYPPYSTQENIAISDILTRSLNVRFFLTGHLHPDNPIFYHHGDVLEVVGTPLFKINGVGLVTYDNHRSAYHQINLDQEKFAVLTHPVPTYQASGRDVFHDEDTEVRALVFSNDDDVLNLSVSGSVSGNLEKKRKISDGVWLYTMPMKLSMGNHNIDLSGDWSGNVGFHIGNTISGFEEKKYKITPTLAYVNLFWVYFIVALVLTLPVHYGGIGESFHRWMNQREYSTHWIFAIFGGILAVKYRTERLPRHIRLTLFFAVLWLIVFPGTFFSIEGSASVLWTWGIISRGISLTNCVGYQYSFYYLFVLVFNVIMFGSAVEATKGHSPIFIFDIILYLGGIAGWGYCIYTLMKINSVIAGALSPAFVIIPLYFHLALIIWSIRTIRDEKQNKDAEITFTPMNNE